MEFKGTKGNWRIESIEGSCSLFIESNSGCLGTVWSNSKTEANAKLIAAAPELLNSLMNILSSGGQQCLEDAGFEDEIKTAQKAIQKALK